MSTEIDIRVKQDFVSLKSQENVPVTDAEAVIFLDKTTNKPKYKELGDGAVFDIRLGGDVDSASVSPAVQQAIADAVELCAKKGNNTDIETLGVPQYPLFIEGQLSIPNASKFEVYQTEQQFVSGPAIGIPINFQTKLYDQRNEFNIAENAFYPLHEGFYLFLLSVDIYIDAPTADWRVVLSLFANNNERKRIVDASIPLANGGPSGATFLYLYPGTKIDARIAYTNYSFAFYPGSFAARFSMVKIG